MFDSEKMVHKVTVNKKGILQVIYYITNWFLSTVNHKKTLFLLCQYKTLASYTLQFLQWFLCFFLFPDLS